MHASQRPATRQQQRVRRHAGSADAPAMFNLLNCPQLLEWVEVALPEHRDRWVPGALYAEVVELFMALLGVGALAWGLAFLLGWLPS
jgi:hypothetical protein